MFYAGLTNLSFKIVKYNLMLTQEITVWKKRMNKHLYIFDKDSFSFYKCIRKILFF